MAGTTTTCAYSDAPEHAAECICHDYVTRSGSVGSLEPCALPDALHCSVNSAILPQEMNEKVHEVHEHVAKSVNCSLASKADRGDVWGLRDHADARFAALQTDMQRLRQEVAESRADADGIRERAARAEATCEELQREICRQADCLAVKADQRALECMQDACRSHVKQMREVAQSSACSLKQLRDKVREYSQLRCTS